MSTYYAIREPGGRTVDYFPTLQSAQRAKRILEEKTGVKLTVYGPERQTFQRALEALR